MEKINVVLVFLNPESLENTVNKLNFDNVNLTAIIVDGSEEKIFLSGKEKIPIFSFVQIQLRTKKYKDHIWLIVDALKESAVLRKMKKFLIASDVPEENIVNFETPSQLSETWLANLRHIEEHGADFFVTGNEYIRDSLDFKCLPSFSATPNESGEGVNLANPNQTLRQSYLTAKCVFEHVGPDKIKVALIGLTPDSFFEDDTEDFFSPQQIKALSFLTAEQADLNFDSIKETLNRDFSAQAIAAWEDNAPLPPTDNLEKNIQILRDYIKLCVENGARPVGVVFPVVPAVRKTYDEERLNLFRETIRNFEEDLEFCCFDMFNLNLAYDSFCDMYHMNTKGITAVSSLLALKLNLEKIIPVESFCNMTYDYFYNLSNIAPKAKYNELITRVFEISAQRIRRKKKIQIAFVTHLASQWCGDDLYNLFAKDERFNVKIFLCRPYGKNELFQKDLKKFKTRLKTS